MGRGRFHNGLGLALLALVALAPAPLGSNRPMFWMLSAALVFLLATVFFARMAWQGRRWPIPLRAFWPLALGAGLYLGFIALQASELLASAASVAPRASLLAFIRALSYAVFFFLVLQMAANGQRARWMVKGLLLSVLVYALLGFLARFGAGSGLYAWLPQNPDGNATGPFINRNAFATYLGFGLLTALALFARRLRALTGPRFADPMLLLYGAAGMLILVTLLATNSRMGTASALFAAGSFVALLLAKRQRLGAGRIALGGLLLALGLAAAFYLYGGALLERLGSVERDADVRFALYQQVWEMILARPWAGFGADSFALAFQPFHHLPVSPDLVWDKAHNTYLANWAELGLVFGSLPVAMLAGLAVYLGRVALTRRRNFILPLWGLCLILQGGLHALADFSLEIQADSFLFLAALAMALADALTARSHKGGRHARSA